MLVEGWAQSCGDNIYEEYQVGSAGMCPWKQAWATWGRAIKNENGNRKHWDTYMNFGDRGKTLRTSRSFFATYQAQG